MWLTALVVGLAASLHCVGMCSPLAFAVATVTPATVVNRLLYNAGRVFTYGMLGAVIAGAGVLLPFAQYQNVFSIVLGSALVTFGAVGFGGLRIPGLTPLMEKMSVALKSAFSAQIKRKTHWSVALLGVFNGLLPCGMTVIALGYCVTLRGPVDGFNFMLLFGVGTLPAMLGFTSLLVRLVSKLKVSLQRLSSVLMAASGLLLIVRVLFVVSHQAGADGVEVSDVLCR